MDSSWNSQLCKPHGSWRASRIFDWEVSKQYRRNSYETLRQNWGTSELGPKSYLVLKFWLCWLYGLVEWRFGLLSARETARVKQKGVRREKYGDGKRKKWLPESYRWPCQANLIQSWWVEVNMGISCERFELPVDLRLHSHVLAPNVYRERWQKRQEPQQIRMFICTHFERHFSHWGDCQG